LCPGPARPDLLGALPEVMRVRPSGPNLNDVLRARNLTSDSSTVTITNQVVGLDEDTGAVVTRSPTGDYPDGLAFDQRRAAIWTTNETGGTETVIDAATGKGRGSVDLGGEVGNVVYDPAADQMWVAVQGRNDLAAIDPATLTVTHRVPLSGWDHPHGLAIDRAAGWAWWPATATPPCSPSTSPPGRPSAAAPSAHSQMCWLTTRPPTGSTSPPKAAGS
jgi:hypothetical protein